MIPLNDFHRLWALVGADVHAAVERVGASGRYILGREVERFEAALATRLGVGHVVGVASGLDALEIGLRVLGIRHGDEVLTTPLSAFATTLAVIRAGGTPVFADVDSDGLLDLEATRQLLTERRQAGNPIRYLLPVHLFGRCLRLDRLRALKDEFGLLVLEDCAQSLGASFQGCPAGTVGQVAATSFYPTKNLGALGDAGAVLTADPNLARRARAIRNYGQSSLYQHDELGMNSRLDEVQAAILSDVMLPRMDTWNARRAAIATEYLTHIENPAVVLPSAATGSGCIWHLFPIRIDPAKRDAAVEHLRSCGVTTGIHYPRLIPRQAALAVEPQTPWGDRYPHAQRLCDSEISLPIHPFLGDDEVERVVEATNRWRC